jgi:hypothetical protein
MATNTIKNNTIHWYEWSNSYQKKLEFPISNRLNKKLMWKNIYKIQNANLDSMFNSWIIHNDISIKFIHRRINLDKVKKLSSEIAVYELIARRRESQPLLNTHKKELERFSKTFFDTYCSVYNVLAISKPDIVYLYNGRFLQERAAWQACLDLKIPVKFYEKFSTAWFDRYFVFSKPVHSINYRSQLMSEFGNKLLVKDIKKSLQIAEKWFLERRMGITQDFTKIQSIKRVDSFTKPYFVYFHSSEDELISKDLVSNIWGNQFTALLKLVECIKLSKNAHLVIRLHPNLLNKSKREINHWMNFTNQLKRENPWISVVPPRSKINTYSLIDGSKGVISVGSTVGIEAVFFRKKSILIGRAFYEHMGITLNPANSKKLHEYLLKDLSNFQLNSKKLNAAKFGLFQELGGEKFKFIKLFRESNRIIYMFEDLKIASEFEIVLIRKIEIYIKALKGNAIYAMKKYKVNKI